jgi:hypothetical protein
MAPWDGSVTRLFQRFHRERPPNPQKCPAAASRASAGVGKRPAPWVPVRGWLHSGANQERWPTRTRSEPTVPRASAGRW